MSIQRYESYDAWEADEYEGRYVLYADHVAAMQAEAESAHDLGVIYGINHERARIRAAVEAAWKAGFAPVMNFGLRGDPKPYPLEPSCYECNGEQYGADAAMDVVLAIIDGDADA